MNELIKINFIIPYSYLISKLISIILEKIIRKFSEYELIIIYKVKFDDVKQK